MLATDQRLGPYEIQSSLGSGGMGEVYRAKDTRLHRDVALKVLPPEFASHPERMIRFEQEARAASALNHPTIITIFDVGFMDGKAYIAMELIEGKNLADLLKTGPLPLKKVVAIGSQLADGLAKAHGAGIIHRDLKPENLMITGDGFLKILDFGLAKLTDDAGRDVETLQTQTSAGIVVGTAGYMSPEQAAGRAVDFRSDQFSFGSILYEIITGKRAFKKATGAETMAAVIREEPDSISYHRPSIPGPLRWIVERCMAKDPNERYESTRDLARDFQILRENFAEMTSSGESTSTLPGVRPRRNLLIPVIAALALVAGAAAHYIWNRPPQAKLIVSRTLTYSGSDSSPTISPNGELIAFRSDRDGTPRIWLKQMKAGNEIALTEGSDNYPRFSPDGSLLLFIRKQEAGGSLYRVPVLGGESRKVIDDAVSADWSPDGKEIAFVRWKAGRSGFNSDVMTAKQDGSDLIKIIEVKDRQLLSVRWSPDGRYLVATVVIQGNYGSKDAIALIDIKEKSLRWIPSTSNNPTAAIWSGKKNHIAYFLPETGVALFQIRGASTLFVQDVETGNRKPVFWAPSTGDIMDIAGSGRIILHSASLRENLRQIKLNSENQAESWSWLTRGNSANRQPSYSADGKRILFSSNMAGNLDLWDLSTETRGLRRITEDAAEDWDPAYSPDGRYILWSSNRNGHFEIWIANSDGSGARQVTQDGVDAENPGMTVDGKWVIYNSYNPDLKIRGVWKIRPDGSDGTRIVPGLTQWPEISADGQYASYGFYKHSLNDRFTYNRVVEIETGTQVPFEIEVSNRDRVGGRMRWMPDGKSIVFIDEDKTGMWGLFVQDFVPGQNTLNSRRSLAGFDADRKIDTFAISPDGSNIVLAEVEVLSSLIEAEGIPEIQNQH